MKIIIDIPNHIYNILKDDKSLITNVDHLAIVFKELVKKSTPLPEDNWIPITFIKDKYDNYTFTSEMPKNNQKVLITDYYDEVRMETCKIDSYGDLCNSNGDIFGLTAKAWMPLPEPYKAESEKI